jgi:Mg2+ and Co2+ transporter CorA
VSHVWRNIKNSQTNGHRPVEEFRAELMRELDEFVALEPPGFSVHSNVLEAIGFGEGERVVDVDQIYSNPFPRLENHGQYLFGCFSIPTDLADGVSEFTSLFILATRTQLLSVIMDPHTSYAGPFGQRLLNRRSHHLEFGNDDVGETMLMIIRDAITSVNFALAEIFEDIMHYSNNMGRLASRKEAEQSEVLALIESYVLRLRVEIESLETVTCETASLATAVADGGLDLQGDAEIFYEHHLILAKGLAISARQTVSFRNKIESRIIAVLDKCDQMRDRMLVTATHKIGAIASLLLVPTLIVGIYGQNLDIPEQRWNLGYEFSWVLIIASTVIQLVYFKKKKWL